MEEILHQAERLEKEYDWLGAVESYRKALNLLSGEDFSHKGDVTERLGYAFYRFAFQAETNEQFRERMRQSTVAYGKAVEFYGGLKESMKTARTLRCNAMIAYVGYWLTPEAPEKKRLVDECWRLTKEALKAFDEAKEVLEYGKTYNQISASASHLHDFEWNLQDREKIVRDAMEIGERAITFLSNLGDTYELARAYVRTAQYLDVLGGYFPSIDKQREFLQKAASYWSKAGELSEEAAMIELPTILSDFGSAGTDKDLMNSKKALEYCGKTRDHFTIGCALKMLDYHTGWKAMTTEDPDERIELYKNALQYTEDAKHSYSIISFASPEVEAPFAEHYFDLARFETNPSKRRNLLEKALEATPDLLKRAENSGYPEALFWAENIFGRILWLLAKTETDFDEKTKHLEKALKHSNDSIRLSEQIKPTSYWNRAVLRTGLARTKSELANLAKDPETKKNMLQEAAQDYENILGSPASKWLESLEVEAQIPLYVPVAIVTYEWGDLLKQLYGITNDGKYLRKAVEVFEEAAKSFQKPNLMSRVAECYWKIAQIYDSLGEHSKAAENFKLASNNYTSAAEKIPQLKSLYQDHARYMQAWSEIENARHDHSRLEYGQAKEHYERAATIHKSLKQWSYLALNYYAWVQLENAEDSSRKEQSGEALQAFEKAARLFTETKKSLQTEIKEIVDQDEKTMVIRLIEISDQRREYCEGRMALEEAKILDKKGDHYSSSQKYDSAAQTFERILQSLETEQDQREFKLILTLSRAWQKMALAEAELSSALYLEASQLFEQAKEFNPNEKTKMLVLGHSRFCKALEAGTRFADSREPALHQTAEQHLESAANYYVRAGFHNASEYSRAMEYLFDAYLYMDDAKREKDPEKKARLYTMAEKVLQTSAGSFMKAEQPEKTEQVQRLVEKVREERELAMSLSEIFHAPSIVSTTAAFNTPSPTHEDAVGLEKFEHADVHANIIVDRNELNVGENLDLEIELANAGKGTALLDKIERAIPNGFEVAEKLQTYRVEDCNVNMKGKRLEQLKSEDVKFRLKPKHKGSFTFGPVILYLDENGNAKSHEPQPVTVTVKELGIKGWIKGER